ncbi:Rer1 family protein [Striga asiatica]|uniref:Rer1 family protein n=1 Tax=Striga asiatica TaxID=4170 RepID=A0A5A7QPX2_STRAF|nr:Rer1 family protein [Striga asiatica]
MNNAYSIFNIEHIIKYKYVPFSVGKQSMMERGHLQMRAKDSLIDLCRSKLKFSVNSQLIVHCGSTCIKKDFVSLREKIGVDDLVDHLTCNEINQSYTCWTKHGEMRKQCPDKKI